MSPFFIASELRERAKLSEPNDEQAEDIKDDLLVAPNFPGGPKLKPRVPTRIGSQPIARAEWQETWKTASDHAMVALRIPLPIAQQIAIKGGERAADLHVTLVYLGDVAAIEPKKLDELRMLLKRIAHDTPPLTGRIQGYGRFNPQDNDGDVDDDVIWVGYDSPDLPELRHKVLQACRDAAIEPQGDHGFTPHITLAYVEPGEGEDSMPPNLDCPIKYLSLALGSQEIEIPLQGEEDDENEKPQATLSPDTFSTLQAPQRVSGRMLDLDQWAQDKGDLMVRPDVLGVGCVVVKKGDAVHVAIENWGAPAYVGDLVNAMKRIPHDYIMVGRLCAYDVLTEEWLDGERMAQVLTAERVAEPIFFPADLLVLDGDASDLPARERFERMRVLVPIAGSHVICPPQIEAGANRTLDRAVNAAAAWEPYGREETWHCPGVTVVVADSPYQHGVTDDETRLTIGVRKDFAFGAGPGVDTERPGDFHSDEKNKPNFLVPTKKFDPDQPRDDQGQWTDAGGSKPGSKLTDDFKAAIANTVGAKVGPEGLTLHVSRYQDPEQAGERSVRTGVMFLPEEKSPWAKAYRGGNKQNYGGSMLVTGERQFKHPYFVKASTGGKAPEKAYDAIEGKDAYEKMRSAALTPPVMTTGFFSGEQSTAKQVEGVKGFLSKYGGDPSMAEDIIEHSKGGNLLPYALQEHIVAHSLRKAGYDSIIGMSKFKGQPRLAEVFDLTMSHYPDSEEVTKGVWIWKDAAAGVFGTPGAAGIMAPQQGMFGKPRRSRNVNSDESRTEKNDVGGDFYGASVPLAMIPTRPGKKPQNQDGETLDWPTYGRPGDTNYAEKYSDDQARDDQGQWTSGGGMWHGSPSGDFGPAEIHVGTKRAAKQALEARIGLRADGKDWDGTSKYSETKLAGQKTLKTLDSRGYNVTGYNMDAPEDDYYPTKMPTFAGGKPMTADMMPSLFPVRITGDMTNTPQHPHSDAKANGMIKRGNIKRGFYYSNVGEDAGSISAVVPSKAHLARIAKPTKSVGSGDISGGGNGDGDSFSVGPGVVGAHTFRTGTLKDGMIVADPKHPRVNPYEAIFQRKGVRLGWTSLRKDQYDRAVALRDLEQEESHARVNSTIVGATIMNRRSELAEAGFTPEQIKRFAGAAGVGYMQGSPPIDKAGIEQTLLNNPRLKKPERFPQVGEEMGFNDTYDALAKIAKIGWTDEAREAALETRRRNAEVPKATETVDGLTVRGDLSTDRGADVDNMSSISASLGDDYEILDDIREVPMSAFEDNGKPSFYSATEESRVKALAEEIKASGEISPLIVVYDHEKSPYVLEGGHRFDALKLLGKKSLPALVVIDTSDHGVTKAGSTGKGIIAIDFDGTCTINADGTENPKMRKLVEALTEKGTPVVIFTARPADEVEEWLMVHGWPEIQVTNEKSPDFTVMLDDRGVSFEPAMLNDIPNLTASLANFKTWWEKSTGPTLGSVSRTLDMVEGNKVVVRHIFYGDSLSEVKHIIQAHRQADQSLDAALDGRPYAGIEIHALAHVDKVGWTDEARAAAAETRRRNAAGKKPRSQADQMVHPFDPATDTTDAGFPKTITPDTYKVRMRDASGEVLVSPDAQVYSGTSHSNLAASLGTDVSSAVESGYVRGRVDGGIVSIELDWENPKAASNASALIQAHGKDSNIYIDGPLHSKKPTVAFRNPGARGKAMRFLESGGKDHSEVEPLSSRLVHMAKSEQTAIPGTDSHVKVLTAQGWEFHANDHDSVVYVNPETEDEVRVWASGHWIHYTEQQAFVSEGRDADALDQDLGVKKAWNEEDHPRVESGEHGGEFASGSGAQASVAAKPAAPKWKKSKDKHNEFGYAIEHEGRTYEVYHDAAHHGWQSYDLLNASGPGGSPVDWVGHNKADVNERIANGELARKIDKYKPQGPTAAAKKLIEDAGARWDGVQEHPSKGPHASFTDKVSGSTAMLKIDGLTAEHVRTKLDELHARFNKAETVDAIKAAVAEVMPMVKGHDEIIAAVIAKLGKKPVAYRQIPVRDEVTKRILYVDNVPIPEGQ